MLKNAWNSGFAMPLGESFSISRSERGKIRTGDSYTNNHAASLDDATHVQDETDNVENMLATQQNRKDMQRFISTLFLTGQLTKVALAAAMTVPLESLKHGLEETSFKSTIKKKVQISATGKGVPSTRASY